MFDFSWSELLLIGIVALVFIGPKELPGVLRTLGQWMGKIRRMASEFQNQFHDAMREAELADLKKELNEMTMQTANIDPLADVRKGMETAKRDIENAVADRPVGAAAPAERATPPEAQIGESSAAGHPIPAVADAVGKDIPAGSEPTASELK